MNQPKIVMQYNLDKDEILIQWQDIPSGQTVDLMWLDKDEWEEMKGKIDGLFKK